MRAGNDWLLRLLLYVVIALAAVEVDRNVRDCRIITPVLVFEQASN